MDAELGGVSWEFVDFVLVWRAHRLLAFSHIASTLTYTYVYIYLGIYHEGLAASFNGRLKQQMSRPTGSSIISFDVLVKCQTTTAVMPASVTTWQVLNVGWWGAQPPNPGGS